MEEISMKKQVVLNENQFHTLKFMLRMEALTEEKSISNVVVETSRNIIKAILNDFPKCEKIKVGNHNEFKGSFRMLMFNSGIYTVNYTCYSVSREKFNLSEYNLTSSADVTNRILSINFLRVDGNIDARTLDDAVCHEVEHVFQSLAKPKSIIYDKGIYDKAIKVLNDKNASQEEFDIARIIYLSQYSEQDAMAHGLYLLLKTSKEKGISFGMALHSSDAYRQLQFLFSMTDKLEKAQFDLKENYSAILMIHYKRDLDWLEKVLYKALKRFNKKIAHVVEKFKLEEKYKGLPR